MIVDTLAAWARVKNEDDNSEMTEAFGPLVELTGTGVPVGVNVRAWKSFGSVPDAEADAHHIAAAGAIEADASLIAIYKKTKPGTNDNMRFFKVCRNRYEEQSNYVKPMYVEQLPGGELAPASLLAPYLAQRVRPDRRLSELHVCPSVFEQCVELIERRVAEEPGSGVRGDPEFVPVPGASLVVAVLAEHVPSGSALLDPAPAPFARLTETHPSSNP